MQWMHMDAVGDLAGALVSRYKTTADRLILYCYDRAVATNPVAKDRFVEVAAAVKAA